MNKYIQFLTRNDFRNWLEDNSQSSAGVWLLFGKNSEIKTIKASEALEEALCYGWIDGQIKNLNEKSYIKYFSIRRKNSKWSDKNKALVIKLEAQGIMTNYGRLKIEEAKKNGQWETKNSLEITDEHIAILSDLLKPYEQAYTNFIAMSTSVKKTYSRAYFDAKTDDGRSKRLAKIVERLNQNLKPM